MRDVARLEPRVGVAIGGKPIGIRLDPAVEIDRRVMRIRRIASVVAEDAGDDDDVVFDVRPLRPAREAPLPELVRQPLSFFGDFPRQKTGQAVCDAMPPQRAALIEEIDELVSVRRQ